MTREIELSAGTIEHEDTGGGGPAILLVPGTPAGLHRTLAGDRQRGIPLAALGCVSWGKRS
jgi:hypothetical protein